MRLCGAHRAQNLAARGALEGHVVRQEDVEHDAAGPHVGLLRDVLAAGSNLRRDVEDSATHVVAELRRRGGGGADNEEVKVDELHDLTAVRWEGLEDEVFELDIAMGGALGMEVGHSIEELAGQEEDLGL